MEKLLSLLRQLLSNLPRRAATADPLANLSPREWADLPVYHPRCEA